MTTDHDFRLPAILDDLADDELTDEGELTTDPEFMLAEIVGDALAEMVKSVRELVDGKEAAADTKLAEFRQQMDRAIGQLASGGFAEALQGVERRLAERLEAIKAELRAELDPARWIAQLAETLKSLPAPLVQPSIVLPDQPAPVVHNHLPPPRLVEKTHEYDQYNRPVRTTERELKEDTGDGTTAPGP